MAHIDNTVYRKDPVDRAPLRTGADTWHALALTTVAWLGIVPALIVGALLVVEALLPRLPHCGVTWHVCIEQAVPAAAPTPVDSGTAKPLITVQPLLSLLD